jgi:hypothetical protein
MHKHYTTEMYEVQEVKLHVFSKSVLVGGQKSTLLSGHFTAGNSDSGAYWVWGWLCPRVGLDAVTKRRHNAPVGNCTSRQSVIRPVILLTHYLGLFYNYYWKVFLIFWTIKYAHINGKTIFNLWNVISAVWTSLQQHIYTYDKWASKSRGI